MARTACRRGRQRRSNSWSFHARELAALELIHKELLAAAGHRTKREVEHQIACLAPRPDAKALIRRLPAPTSVQNAAVTLVTSSLPPDLGPWDPEFAPAVSTPRATPLAAAEPQTRVAALEIGRAHV